MFEINVDNYHDLEAYQELGGDYERNFFLASIAISLKRIADAQSRQLIPNYNILNTETIC